MKKRWDDLTCPFLNLKCGKIESVNHDYYHLNRTYSRVSEYFGFIELKTHHLINDGTEHENTTSED